MQTLERSVIAAPALAGALVVAGGSVAAANSAVPFEHGSWLAAYLVLVGGVAQLLLVGGRLLLPGVRAPAGAAAWAELALWNAGCLVVPAGVLAGLPALVLAGSVALLAALVLFSRAVRSGGRRPGRLAYHALVLALGVSVLTGCVLADAVPGVAG